MKAVASSFAAFALLLGMPVIGSSADYSVIDLGTLRGDFDDGLSLSQNGLVTAASGNRALLFDGTTRDLGTLGGSTAREYGATAIGQDLSLTYVSGVSGPVVTGDLVISLANVDGPQVDFDNVRLTANAVPEPSSIMLVLTGIALVSLMTTFRRFGLINVMLRGVTVAPCFMIRSRLIAGMMICAVLGVLQNHGTAATIPSLYNTGIDFGGHHYSLISSPVGGTNDLELFTFSGQWFASDATSAWIAPDQAGQFTAEAGPEGLYDYRTTFDLTGFDPSTALISGRWAADNVGYDVLINGHSTANATTHFNIANDFLQFYPFSISSNFVSGLNTLDFLVSNGFGPGPNPTGLRVEILNATVNGVPEPSSWVLLGLGAAGVFLAARRRRAASACQNPRSHARLCCFAVAVYLAQMTATQASTINSVIMQPRDINDVPTSTLTVVDNYPSLVSFEDQRVSGETGFANRHIWDFSSDAGASSHLFQNNDFFQASMTLTLTGTGSTRKEAGFLLASPVAGDGEFVVDTDNHEVVAFGGPFPFFAFPRTFNSGDTITLGLTYFLDGNGKRAIVYSANGVQSPIKEFANIEQGIADNSTLGGDLLVVNNALDPSNSGTALFQDISVSVPEPTSIALLGTGLIFVAGSCLRRKRRHSTLAALTTCC